MYHGQRMTRPCGIVAEHLQPLYLIGFVSVTKFILTGLIFRIDALRPVGELHEEWDKEPDRMTRLKRMGALCFQLIFLSLALFTLFVDLRWISQHPTIMCAAIRLSTSGNLAASASAAAQPVLLYFAVTWDRDPRGREAMLTIAFYLKMAYGLLGFMIFVGSFIICEIILPHLVNLHQGNSIHVATGAAAYISHLNGILVVASMVASEIVLWVHGRQGMFASLFSIFRAHMAGDPLLHSRPRAEDPPAEYDAADADPRVEDPLSEDDAADADTSRFPFLSWFQCVWAPMAIVWPILLSAYSLVYARMLSGETFQDAVVMGGAERTMGNYTAHVYTQLHDVEATIYNAWMNL